MPDTPSHVDAAAPTSAAAGADGLLLPEAVRLREKAVDRTEAVRRCGQVLVETGAVEPAYIEAMLERERVISTYVGESAAIPHATLAGKKAVLRDAVAVVKLAEPVDWDGFPVSVCIAIAARGDGHLRILSKLAEILLDQDRARSLREADDVAEVIRLLQPTTAT